MGGIKDNPTEIQIIKYWYNYAKNLLTSSTIVFSFVGKYFKKVVIKKKFFYLGI